MRPQSVCTRKTIIPKLVFFARSFVFRLVLHDSLIIENTIVRFPEVQTAKARAAATQRYVFHGRANAKILAQMKRVS